MILVKDNPVGIDARIQKLQRHLYGEMLDIWAIPESAISSYGRCYRTQSKGGYIPEVYQSKGEYGEVMVDDTKSVVAFFGTASTVTTNPKNRAAKDANVHLIMFVNLNNIKISNNRADEEARLDIHRLVHERYGFHVTAIKTGLNEVFSEYQGVRLSEGLKHRDMHPFHCFRLDMAVTYDLYEGCGITTTERDTGIFTEEFTEEFA